MTYQLHNQSEHGVIIEMLTRNGLTRWMQLTAKGNLMSSKCKTTVAFNDLKPTKEMIKVAREVYQKIYS